MGKRNWRGAPAPETPAPETPAQTGTPAASVKNVTWTSSDGTVYTGKVVNQKTILEVELPDKTVIGVNAADVKAC